ncbi:MAG: hypothetical protein ACI93R_002891 [Flavobacteriales bacterium]|jgi:hypothetical protein
MRIIKKVIKEPLVVFLLVAFGLMSFDYIINQKYQNVILVNDVVHTSIIDQSESLKGHPLTLEEERIAIDEYLNRRMLLDEARRLGLQDDISIENKLVRKLRAILSVTVEDPSEENLRQYYLDHRQNYQYPERWDIEYISVPIDKADELALELNKLEDNSKIIQLVNTAPVKLNATSQRDVLIRLGLQASEVLHNADTGVWSGPHNKPREKVFLRVLALLDSDFKPFVDVERYVRDAWINEQRELLVQEKLSELRKDYVVRYDIVERS